LHAVLGIQVFKEDGSIIGMLGIVNKLNAYDELDIDFLERFTATCCKLIQAYWQIEGNQDF
jgi:putative methionine-R-sulfoxide reductase with GAF domain